MSISAPARRPLWRRPVFYIPVIVVAIPAVWLAWWLGSPLFIDKTVIEEFPEAVSTGAPATATIPEPGGPVAILSGVFTDADSAHHGSGDAALYELDDGSLLLRFEDLDVTNGPDLHVFLVPVADPTRRQDVMTDGYLDLGELKGNRGDQNYPVDAGFDPSGDWTVVIYCVPFHVIFATAALS